MKAVTLYRPIGLKELELIIAAEWKAFPPRLFWQPIFYPVTNQPCAEQIAFEWNTKDEFSGYCGVVTYFEVDAKYLSRYEVHNVGGGIHNELWIPAEELDLFNRHIVGEIKILKVFFGDSFTPPENDAVASVLRAFKDNKSQE